jgi:hypothetical protein
LAASGNSIWWTTSISIGKPRVGTWRLDILFTKVYKCLVIFYLRCTDPTMMMTKSCQKSWKTSYIHFDPTVSIYFMYTNLNIFFSKFIMAEGKSGPPKGRQDIPVSL